MHTVATAGHVDHGKSSLILALTGTDPDRFIEEKQRGLTIDLGFASMSLPSGRQVSFVDVPGHVRFLKNMLAGVGAVAACVFVVAATEGWKPQSEEHLRILELLGLEHGVVVLTKTGVADSQSREIALLDIQDRTAGTFLETAEVVEVDSLDGTGIDQLGERLDDMLERVPPAVDLAQPRLWIDRSFSIKGAGAVVTGTLLGGELALEDKLDLLSQGAPVSVRVRGIQTHDQARETAAPGSRVALNLVGAGASEMRRGDVLVRPGQWHESRVFDASLRVLDSLEHDVSRRGAYVAYLGSGEFPVSLRVLGERDLMPGETGAVRMFLPRKLPLLPGDCYVLREFGRSETAGGGRILDVAPCLPAARAQPLCLADEGAAGNTDGNTASQINHVANTERIVRERGWVKADELVLLAGRTGAEAVAAAGWRVGDWVAWPEELERTRNAIRELLSGGQVGLAGEQVGLSGGQAGLASAQVDLASLDDHQRAALAVMSEAGEVEVAGGLVRLAGQTDELAGHPFLQALSAEPFAPPPPDGVGRTELRAMQQRGLVVEAGGIYFAGEAVAAAVRSVGELLAEQPEGFTVATLRERLGTTRKYIMPLLEILDGQGATRRQGDVRVAGPRLGEQEASV